MSRQLRIRVDHGRCVGNAMCLAIAPGAFGHNEERQSEIVDATGEDWQTIVEAAANCPTNAISVEDADSGEVLFSGGYSQEARPTTSWKPNL